jgi:hypothetical protein
LNQAFPILLKKKLYLENPFLSLCYPNNRTRIYADAADDRGFFLC